jgi:dihydroxyacetone synthase
MAGISSTTAYGDETVKGLLDKKSKLSAPLHTSKDEIQLVLQSFRLLIVDLCEQFGMGKFYRLWFLTHS